MLDSAETQRTIILADDHALIREAVRPYLAQLGSDIAVAEAGSYDEVFTLCARLRESGDRVVMVLLDLNMPGLPEGDLFAGLRRVIKELPGVPVGIFSGTETRSTVMDAIKNGARGFISKGIKGPSMVHAMRLIMAGETYVPASVLAPEEAPKFCAAERSGADDLSPRELESLRMLVKGMSNKEIARELGVQDVTVKLHLRNAYRKLGASNRVDAVRIAVEQQIN